MDDNQKYNSNLAVALSLAENGLLIIPCLPTKVPCLRDWPNAGTINPGTITAWWGQWKDAVPGVLCGPNNLLVVDQDRHKGGVDGVAAWDRLCEGNGLDQGGCLIVETPSGGRHAYFRQNEGHRVGNSAGKIGNGIDTRGDGGYVIAPGAILPDGRTYRVLSGAFESCPVIRGDLCDFLAGKHRAEPVASLMSPAPSPGAPTARAKAYAAKALEDECAKVRHAPEGKRNSTFNNAVFAIATLSEHYGIDGSHAQALKAAARDTGLNDDEIEATFASAAAAGQHQPRAPINDNDLSPIDLSGVTVKGSPIFQGMALAAPRANSGDYAIIRRVSDVEAKPVVWLWPSRVAVGKLTILAGDPGLGKSQLTAFMAAKVTTGGVWPNDDGTPPTGNVIMLSCEDDIADTIRPRLEAAGADLDCVHVIEAVKTGSGQMRGFSLTADLLKLEQAIEAVGGVRLVVVDPITAYLGGTDTHKTGDVRAALAPLQELASRYGIAVVAVSHFNKSAGNGKSVNAVTGSAAFVAASRATFIVTKDSSDPLLRLLIEAKNNLAQAPGLAFRVEEKTLPNGIKAPRVVFESGTVDLTADQAIGEPIRDSKASAIDEAAKFLRAILADGNLPATEVIAQATGAGISEKTLRRASDRCGVLKHKGGYQGEWLWGFAISPITVASLFGSQPAQRPQPKDGQDGHVAAPETLGTFEKSWPPLETDERINE